MKCLINCLSGKELMLCDPIKAANHLKYAEKYGVIDGVLDMFFNPVVKPYVTQLGTAVIPIQGFLAVGLTKFEKMTGASDMTDISNAIDEALANPAVKRIAFEVDSPGGTVVGTPELADKIASIPLPTMSYAKKLMASGAYYTGSQADQVIASASANVGSIGVIAVDESYQAAFEKMGIKVEVFRAGKFKAPNIAGEGYTEDMRAIEQAAIDAMHQEFQQTVLRKRSMANVADMEGQIFTGREAAAKNLITGLASSFEEALAMFEGSDAQTIKRAAVASHRPGKSAKAIVKPLSSVELEPEVVDMLSPRQREMVDNYSDIEETFGAFDQGVGPDGAHYGPVSPFASEGLLCQNCVFYRGPRGCQLVSGDIDPNGICKLWVIPNLT